jgi:hypothetical protein
MNNIEKYYKNVDKPVIDNYTNNFNLKNLLELTSITDLYVFTKIKNNQWKLKDKNKLLQECQKKKNNKIKEVTTSLKALSKCTTQNKFDIKNKNNEILDEINNIDNLIETIEKEYPENYLEIFSN